MKFFLVVVILFISKEVIFCQEDSIKTQKIDSLNHYLRRDSLHTFRFKKLRPYANIDNRNSFSLNHPSNIRGIQFGIIVNEYHTFGIGVYRLTRPSKDKSLIKRNYQINDLQFLTIFYEYFLFNKRYLEIDLPFELGFGKYGAQRTDGMNFAIDKSVAYGFIPIAAGAKFILKPVRWVGLSLMSGYRYVFEQKTNLNLNGAYFSIGIWVDIRQIYRDIKFYGFQKRKYKQEMARLLEN